MSDPAPSTAKPNRRKLANCPEWRRTPEVIEQEGVLYVGGG